jgi:UDP-N-acetylmuramate dehydrogenase
MDIQHNTSLKAYNTFGIDARARLFFEAGSIDDLKAIIASTEYKQHQVLWLGGGSNMLLTQDFDGLVVKINLKGIEHHALDTHTELVCAMAGEVWHSFVMYTLEKGLGGLENLALIPGNVGTTPVQNIGAYGVEMKDTFHSLQALNLETGALETFDKVKCAFGYRDSFFKNEGKGKYIVVKVCFALSKQVHVMHTEYGAIKAALADLGGDPTIQKIAEAVISIRESKLPNPAALGNSGSFFKNPVVPNALAEQIQKAFPNAVVYPTGEGYSKLAAGWLIEQCGFKGYRKGDAGVHKNQALVLVNYGNASGAEIAALAEEIKRAVFTKFAVALEAEVNMI